MIDAFRTIWREEGIRGLYRGIVPALFLTSHGSIQFAVYEYMKEKSIDIFGIAQPVWVPMITGGVSKIIAATATYPYQVIKSRLQQRESSLSISPSSSSSPSTTFTSTTTTTSTSTYLSEPKYKNTRDCIVKIMRHEGPTGFFRGVWLNAIKVAPSAAVTFVAYEETLKYLKKV